MNNLPSFIDEVCTKLDFEQLFVPFGLETSERKPVKCLSPRREANKIIHSFVSSRFDFLFGHIINIWTKSVHITESQPWSLIETEYAGDLGKDSPVQTSPQGY